MACKACGEEPQKCNCQHKDSCMSPAVLEIVNEPEIVTFCKVVIPASAGDEKTNPPLPGLYRNVLLEYEASGEAYLYSSDGIPTKLTDKAELKRLETLIGNEVADRYNADANLQNQINDIPKELPVASTTVLGGIKVGNNLTISEDGTLNATGGSGSGDIVYDRDSNGQPIGVNITDTMATYVKIGNFARVDSGSNSVAIGNSSHTTGDTSIAIGRITEAFGEQTIAIGQNAKVHQTNGTAVGAASIIGGNAEDASVFGHDARAYASDSVAIGHGTEVGTNAYSGIALGTAATVGENARYGIAVGGRAFENYAVAIGSYAEASQPESVSLGYNSRTGRSGEVSVGSINNYRYVANVKDGELDHDAVNMSQLNVLADKVDKLSMTEFPNATIIGDPTINEGQVSNFGDYRYLQFPFVLDLTGKTFQIDFCFATGNDITTQQNIIDSKFGIALAIQNGHGVMSISSNGELWDIGTSTGQINIAANTTYYARLSWDGSVYKTALSTDGVTYTDDMTIVGSNRPFPTTHYIGGANSQILGHYAWPFLGIINLNKCSMTVNGSLIWKGMDNLGLLTRADISLSNIDTAGEQRIRDLAGGGGNYAPTEPTVIGKYGEKDLYRVAIPIGSRTFAASDTIPTGEAGQVVGYITNFTEDSMVVRTYGSISKSSPYAYPRQSRGGVAVPFVEFTEGNSARVWVGKSEGQYIPTPVVLTVTGSSLYGWEGDYVVVEYTI